MMTNAERAKIFAPFDAMKGLQEALRNREERRSRVEKHEITEEIEERNSKVFLKLERGVKVEIFYYCAFHDIVKKGIVTDVDYTFRSLKLGTERIWFDDIYSIKIAGMN